MSDSVLRTERAKRKLRKIFKQCAKSFFKPSPVFRFFTTSWGHCRVQGCKRFCADRPLCRKHQGSTKFQHLANGQKVRLP